MKYEDCYILDKFITILNKIKFITILNKDNQTIFIQLLLKQMIK